MEQPLRPGQEFSRRVVDPEYVAVLRETAQESLEWAKQRTDSFRERFEELLATPESRQAILHSELRSTANTTLMRFTVDMDVLAQAQGSNEKIPDDLVQFAQSGPYQAMLIYTCLERSMDGGSSMPEFYNQIIDQPQLVQALIAALPKGYPLPDTVTADIEPFLSSEYAQKLVAENVVTTEQWSLARDAIRLVRDEQVKIRLGLNDKE